MREIDKSGWAKGPWHQEPDKKQWLDEETALPCLAVRHPELGHWCGYVGVSKDHPDYEKTYNSVDVEVHCGLTYADHCQGDICHTVEPGEDDNVWWLGFDCAHGGDLSPGSISRIMSDPLLNEYRDLPYIETECRGLARRLKARAAKAVQA